jgi:hypothetical protein
MSTAQRRSRPLHFTTTSTGLQIGRSYVRRRQPWSFTRSEDWLQGLLLQKHLPAGDRRLGVLLAIFIGVVFGAFLAHGG